MAVRESGIRYLRFSRVAKGPLAGLDESVEYLDDKRRPQADENGAFGYRLELNSSGLVAEWVNRGPDGADHATNHGVLKEIRTYDAFGNILEAKTVDASGAATASRLGPAVTRMRYDESGNVTRMSFFDEKERSSSSNGVPRARASPTTGAATLPVKRSPARTRRWLSGRRVSRSRRSNGRRRLAFWRASTV
jgi:YD repeat-containing protein